MRTASQPYRELTTAAINVQGPYGQADYDSFQASVNKRMSDGLGDVEILGGLSPYFDVTAFRPVTDVRFGTSGYNAFRGPGVANLDLSLFRTFALGAQRTLQIRIEALNATNTPHFANPAANVSNLQLNPDGSVRSLNGFGVITSTNRLGRQYDEREFRLGLRLTF